MKTTAQLLDEKIELEQRLEKVNQLLQPDNYDLEKHGWEIDPLFKSKGAVKYVKQCYPAKHVVYSGILILKHGKNIFEYTGELLVPGMDDIDREYMRGSIISQTGDYHKFVELDKKLSKNVNVISLNIEAKIVYIDNFESCENIGNTIRDTLESMEFPANSKVYAMQVRATKA